MCSNGVTNQALMVQGASSTQPTSNVEAKKQQEVLPINSTFINQQEEEHCVVNRDNAPSGVCTRAKKKSPRQ